MIYLSSVVIAQRNRHLELYSYIKTIVTVHYKTLLEFHIFFGAKFFLLHKHVYFVFVGQLLEPNIVQFEKYLKVKPTEFFHCVRCYQRKTCTSSSLVVICGSINMVTELMW